MRTEIIVLWCNKLQVKVSNFRGRLRLSILKNTPFQLVQVQMDLAPAITAQE